MSHGIDHISLLILCTMKAILILHGEDLQLHESELSNKLLDVSFCTRTD